MFRKRSHLCLPSLPLFSKIAGLTKRPLAYNSGPALLGGLGIRALYSAGETVIRRGFGFNFRNELLGGMMTASISGVDQSAACACKCGIWKRISSGFRLCFLGREWLKPDLLTFSTSVGEVLSLPQRLPRNTDRCRGLPVDPLVRPSDLCSAKSKCEVIGGEGAGLRNTLQEYTERTPGKIVSNPLLQLACRI